MKTIRLPSESVPFENGCIALGNFDGIHKGHQKVIATCIEQAQERGVKSAVYTFAKHHKTVFGDLSKVITHTEAKKAVLLEKLKPDYLLLQDADEAFLAKAPEVFVKQILKETLKASLVVVGSHYSFGVKGVGNTDLLKALCAKEGIEVMVLPLMYEDGVLLSSTQIREYISAGNMEQANRMLGYDFFVMGEVVHGNHIGDTIGFPTINIAVNAEQILPVYGVYASVTEIDGVLYHGVSNVGLKPTVGADRPLIETHLFGVRKNFYGMQAKVSLKKQLRTEKRFSGLDELKAQIALDCAQAKAYLNQSL